MAFGTRPITTAVDLDPTRALPAIVVRADRLIIADLGGEHSATQVPVEATRVVADAMSEFHVLEHVASRFRAVLAGPGWCGHLRAICSGDRLRWSSPTGSVPVAAF
jgi:hypothetical protein